MSKNEQQQWKEFSSRFNIQVCKLLQGLTEAAI